MSDQQEDLSRLERLDGPLVLPLPVDEPGLARPGPVQGPLGVLRLDEAAKRAGLPEVAVLDLLVDPAADQLARRHALGQHLHGQLVRDPPGDALVADRQRDRHGTSPVVEPRTRKLQSTRMASPDKSPARRGDRPGRGGSSMEGGDGLIPTRCRPSRRPRSVADRWCGTGSDPAADPTGVRLRRGGRAAILGLLDPPLVACRGAHEGPARAVRPPTEGRL